MPTRRSSSIWATYRQYAELGAQVRKGEKASLIVKYGEWIPKEQREAAQASGNDDDAEDGKRLYAKPAWVFNIDQVDAPDELRAGLAPAEQPRPDLTTRLVHVDAFIAATGIAFREGGQRAFYRHRDAKGEGDFIQMPPRNLFTGTATSTPTEAYESTRLHELGHASGAQHRLNRELGKRFGDQAYSAEELCAELISVFLCAHLGIENTPRPDHAQYIAHWLEILKGNKKAIFTAASLANQAVDFLYSFQPKPEPDPGGPDGDRSTPQRQRIPTTPAAIAPEGPR